MDDAYHTLRELGIEGLHCTSISPVAPGLIKERSILKKTLTNGNTREVAVMNGVSTAVLSGNPARLLNGHPDSSQEGNYTHAAQTNEAPVQKLCETTTLEIHKSATKYQILVWSAKDEAALKRMLQRNAGYYETHVAGSQELLRQLSYTLAARRSPMTWRSFALVEPGSAPDSASLLNASTSNIIRSARNPGLAFVFTGQGAQHPKMGLELLQYPVFEDVMGRASSVFQKLGAKWTLLGA